MIDAAIVIPVYRAADGDLHIVVILRNPGGVHGGQIGFPGGKRDREDRTMLDTALREALEELGLELSREDIIAELPVEQTRTTGYRVFPYLARITLPERWHIAEREIAEIIDVNVPKLANPGAREKMIERFPNRTAAGNVSFYQIGEHRLWGLSYRILNPIIPRLLAGEWDI